MKITREIIINGESQNVEYKLTGIELERAYREYKYDEDERYVLAWLKENGYERWDEIDAETVRDRIARYQQEREALDESMGTNQILAVEAMVNNEFKALLEQYKEKWKVFGKEVTLTLTKEYTIKAKNKEDAERIFEAWSDSRHGMDQIMCELTEDVQYDGDAYEEDASVCDPDNADISEEDV